MNHLWEKLSDQQKKATSIDRNIAVTAGAGSGKTRVLAHRYVRILDHYSDINPSEIVAITFSRQAAADMRKRIREIINDTILTSSNNQSRIQKWKEILIQLPTAPIGTIHSFAANILRDFPSEAGVDPGFSIADENDQEFLARKAIVQSLRNIESDNQLSSYLQTAISYLNYSSLIDIIVKLITDPILMDKIAPDKSIQTDWNSIWTKFIHDKISSFNINQMIDSIQSIAPKNKTETDKRETLLETLAEINHTDNKIRYKSLDNLLAAVFTNTGNPRSTRSMPNLAPQMTTLCSIFQSIFWMKDIYNIEIDSEAKQFADAIHAIVHNSKLTLARLRYESTELTFDELEYLTLQLFEKTSSKTKYILTMLRKRFKFIMIDEFQDTNPTQWKIIEYLSSSDGKYIDPNRLFIVGDPKQSIYGFRNADVTVFAAVREKIIQSNRHFNLHEKPFELNKSQGCDLQCSREEMAGDIRLNKNYRSKRSILDFVDIVCAGIMHAGEKFEIAYESLEYHLTDTGTVGLLMPQPQADDSSNTSNRRSVSCSIETAEFIAHHIQSLVQQKQCDFKDIAIMFPRRKYLPTIESGLRNVNIPYTVYKGIGFWERQEIQDTVAFISWLSDPFDRLSLYTVLRSPVFGLSDDALFYIARHWKSYPMDNPDCSYSNTLEFYDEYAIQNAATILPQYLNLTGRIPLHVLLEKFFQSTGAFGSYRAIEHNSRRIANLEKIINIICSLENNGITPIREMARLLERKIENPPFESEETPDLQNDNLVRVMTVHASKGLEFPVVYLLDLEKAQSKLSSEMLLSDPDLGIGFRFSARNSGEASRSTATHKIIQQRLKQKEIAEHKRLLYVAMTRTCNQLFLVSNPEGPGEGILDPPPNSWMNWVVDQLKLTENDFELNTKSLVNLSGSKCQLDIISEISFEKSDAPLPPDTDKIRNTVNQSSTVPPWYITEPLMETAEFNVLSVTQLDLFQKNPDEYLQQFILNTEESDHTDKKLYSADIARNLGTFFHEIVERPEIPSHTYLNLLLDKEINKYGLKDKDKSLFSTRIKKMIENLLNWPRWKNIIQKTKYRELPFCFPMHSAAIEGIIDLLYNDKGIWHIIDYKTDYWPRSIPLTKWIQMQTNLHRFQMQLYALAVKKILKPDQPFIPVTLYFADPGEESTIELNDAELKRIEYDAEQLIQKLVQNSSIV